MTAALPEQDWADAWSEYRSIFDQWGLDEQQARGAVLAALDTRRWYPAGTVDRVCDALKEFTVRAGDLVTFQPIDIDRADIHISDVQIGLAYAAARLRDAQPVEGLTFAAQWFGTAAEDLGPDVCQRLAEHITAQLAEPITIQLTPAEEM